VNVAENQILKALQPNRLQNDHPAACVIAQEYSSATFFSLRFLSRNKKKVGALFKILLSIFLILKDENV
jgi:hypothetical protein